MELFFEIAQRVMGKRDMVLIPSPVDNNADGHDDHDDDDDDLPVTFDRAVENNRTKNTWKRKPLSAFWKSVFEKSPHDTTCFQFYMYMNNIQLTASRQPNVKFQVFFKMLENIFYTTEVRENLFSAFCKTQRTYYALGNLARRFKMKHARCVVDYDLTLTPIDRTKTRQYMTIFQNDAVYLFRIGELIHIVETALCHCCTNFFVDSYSPRNPYTNEPFSFAMLLSIYTHIRESTFRMPILFELFYREFFNLQHFVYNHESLIRERCIERLAQYGDTEVLSYHIRKMLQHMRVFPHIHPKFPTTSLVSIFKPYLSLYLRYLFSTMYGEKKENAYNVLFFQLHPLTFHEVQFRLMDL